MTDKKENVYTKQERAEAKEIFEQMLTTINNNSEHGYVYNGKIDAMAKSKSQLVRYAYIKAFCIDGLLSTYTYMWNDFLNNCLVLINILAGYNNAETSEMLEMLLKGTCFGVLDNDKEKPLQERLDFDINLTSKNRENLYAGRIAKEVKAFKNILKITLKQYAHLLVIDYYINELNDTNIEITKLKCKNILKSVEYKQLLNAFDRFYLQLISMPLAEFKQSEEYMLMQKIRNLNKEKMPADIKKYLKERLKADEGNISKIHLEHYFNKYLDVNNVLFTYDNTRTYASQAITMLIKVWGGGK